MRFLMGFYLLASCGLTAHAAIIQVNPFGTGDYPNIQAAITAASSGDTVALARGVYTRDGNRDVDFLGKQVVLRSIDGDPSGCVINSQGGSLYNHRAFIFDNGEGPGAVLEGLTIRGGLATIGGAILCGANTCPSIRNCVVTGNTATSEGGGIAVFGARTRPLSIASSRGTTHRKEVESVHPCTNRPA